MGFFTPSFDKPGKGIDPNEPQKRSFFRFFDIFFRKFWKFIKLNLLYVLVSIPTFIIIFFLAGIISNALFSSNEIQEILRNVSGQVVEGAEDAGNINHQYSTLIVTLDLLIRFVVSYLFMILLGMGPATAGITYVLRNFAREEHSWLWSDFKNSLKNNFKQSLIVFIIDIVVCFLFYTAFIVYSQMPWPIGGLRYIIFVLSLIYIMMHFYIYPMMITFELKLKDLYKNSLIFAIGKLPSNLFVMAILLLLHLGSVYAAVMFGGAYSYVILLILLLLEILILPCFSAFLINFNAYPKMKTYMLERAKD